ncbi:hypothetical protein HNQ85_000663 [Anoxybacillus calidus]|uniref:Uncharacterized protein n=1 Tax=[Anoxybacillus] calidus TaxID=575178 RepID=A0A7V9YY10_9BACL|nr:hypothetical protein [Anoxybacillus calidus]
MLHETISFGPVFVKASRLIILFYYYAHILLLLFITKGRAVIKSIKFHSWQCAFTQCSYFQI